MDAALKLNLDSWLAIEVRKVFPSGSEAHPSSTVNGTSHATMPDGVVMDSSLLSSPSHPFRDRTLPTRENVEFG